MTERENNKIYNCFAIVIFTFVFIFSASAQNTTKAADDLMAKLQQKVLLTQEQSDVIKPALNEYLTSPSKENQKSLENKIESTLEEKQKMKYNIIKKDWLKSVSKEVNQEKRAIETEE